MKMRLVCCVLLLATTQLHAITRSWTNTLGGSWFVGANWSPNGVPAANDTLLITNSGTYTVLIATNAATAANLTLGGGSGLQTLLNGTTTALGITNVADVRKNGQLILTNAGFFGNLWVQPGGQVKFDSQNNGLQLYNSTITNLGTVTWSSGSLAVGGNNSFTTTISNGGTWQVTGDNPINYGGGSRPRFINGGILRKAGGTGTSVFGAVDLINLPNGLVDVQSGTFKFSAFQTNVLGGNFSAALGTSINFFGSGSCVDAGAVTSGAGTFQFSGGNFYLSTNTIAGIKLTGGELYLATNTFQLGGAITNLTLDGAQLHGTNRVAGTLTYNSGGILDRLTVLPSGQLVLATTGFKPLYGLNLINQGTINWLGGGLAVGGTPGTVVSNGGLWQMSSDDPINYGGGQTAWLTNSGTIRKISGNGASGMSGFSIVNQPTGLIQVDTGSIQLPAGFTNSAGELRLNGGRFVSNGGFTVAGTSILDGNGSIVQGSILGGTLSPGINGPGSITFPQGLLLGGSATVTMEGNGTLPGTQYDRLTVSGSVTLGNATLKVTSLPVVPIGTTFILIDKDGTDPVTGTFNGLPENSLITVSGQAFRIHYAAGSGNDVALVRDTGITAPLLSVGGYSNGLFTVNGLGGSSMAYTVLATTNFIQWTNIGTATSDPSGNLHFVDTNASKFHYRFYRTTN